MKISVIGLGALTAVHAQPSAGPSALAWDYSDTGVGAWAVGTCASSVANQSPIDIVSTTATLGSALVPPEVLGFDAQGLPDSAVTAAIQSGLEVNEHTWEVAWDQGHNATDAYGVVIGDRLYRLAQYHYHSPSEHTVDGNHYDMEAHHVHYCHGASCETPDIDDDEILVVAVFLSVGAENSYLASFWTQFVAGSEPEISNLANPYTAFMPADKSYYQYLGSTTTPPCATNVQWILMEHSVLMGADQLIAYHNSVNTLPQPALPATVPLGVTTPGWNAAWKTNNRPAQILSGIVKKYVQPAPLPEPEDPLHPSTLAGFPWLPVIVALAALALLVAGICFFLNQPKAAPTKRAVKPKPKPPAPVEETVPLMTAPQLLAPQLFQPMPQPYTTMARPAYGYPQGQMVLQP